MTGNPHPDFETSVELASRLLKSQFPAWHHLPIKPVASSGTANAMFRLGDEWVIRLPRTLGAAKAVEKEHALLPELEPRLPLAIPTPIALGAPQDDYTAPWAIYRWLPGADLWTEPLTDLPQAARDLAGFITVLQAQDASTGPTPGRHNSHRGVPLKSLDQLVQRAIAELGSRIDTHWVNAEWERALAQPENDEPVWIHGDLQPGNLLTLNGRISAVIDFGLLGVGDPAADLLPAWNLLDRASRSLFRERLNVDDATWIRGRGWAIYQSVLALPYYWDSNPVMVEMAWRQINEMVADS